MTLRMEQSGDDVLLWIKAVPGAAQEKIAGAVGDRLKVKVNAAPEGGKANIAIRRLVARTLGLKPKQVVLESGHSSAEKVLRLLDCRVNMARERLGV